MTNCKKGQTGDNFRTLRHYCSHRRRVLIWNDKIVRPLVKGLRRVSFERRRRLTKYLPPYDLTLYCELPHPEDSLFSRGPQVSVAKSDFHIWCALVRARFRGPAGRLRRARGLQPRTAAYLLLSWRWHRTAPGPRRARTRRALKGLVRAQMNVKDPVVGAEDAHSREPRTSRHYARGLAGRCDALTMHKTRNADAAPFGDVTGRRKASFFLP
jgi:hypothetical protein